jgi:Rieske Fe-S protein
VQQEGRVLQVSLTAVPKLGRDGASVKVYGAQLPEALSMVRLGQQQYAVTSLCCTHGGAELEYDPEDRRLRCVSFGGSEFELDGTLAEGPADRSLKHYPARVDGDVLVIQLGAAPPAKS